MKSSNSVNQNQHCISQTRQHEMEKLAGEVGKWDIKNDVTVKWREQTSMHRKRAVMQGTKGESRQFKSNVVDKGELVD